MAISFDKLAGWAARARAALEPPDNRERYWDDPLAHPQLRGMSPTELADLPFPRLLREWPPRPAAVQASPPVRGEAMNGFSARAGRTAPSALPCR
ncbi:MAG: hypothetical protein BroJett030_27270 [Alphaproteobacteria bacterium]|nr:MAG: hypothetical protein BroJett030_27270 [Alphaproteobacteria bacterium]